MTDTTYRACTAITLTLGIPALIAAIVGFIVSMQSTEALSIIGMALAVILGTPILVAIILVGVAISIHPRRPKTAHTLAAIGAWIIGVIAALATMIWLPGLTA